MVNGISSGHGHDAPAPVSAWQHNSRSHVGGCNHSDKTHVGGGKAKQAAVECCAPLLARTSAPFTSGRMGIFVSKNKKTEEEAGAGDPVVEYCEAGYEKLQNDKDCHSLLKKHFTKEVLGRTYERTKSFLFT